MKGPELKDGVEFLNVGAGNNDIIAWRTDGGRSFPIDVLVARNEAKEDFYQHTETKTRKTVFIKRKQLVFIIGGNSSIQYQFLEAAIDLISEEFIKNFGDHPLDLLFHGAAQGFVALIPELLETAQKEEIKWVRANCFICHQQYDICVKKSLIKNAKRYPVAVVFFHKGHGLLIYVDVHYEVRAEEMVDITG